MGIHVRIVSDVVCPWCWIGKRRFERALDSLDPAVAAQVVVEYLPFQLDPGAPRVAQPVAEVYAKKFGGPERGAAVIDHVTAIAAAEGLDYRMDRALRANTFDAHRLLWWAGRPTGLPGGPVGAQVDLEERLMRAYFTEGLDVSDRSVLARCAADVGLDGEEATSLLAGGAGADEVLAAIEEVRGAGVTAVPTYVITSAPDVALADGFALPGAQDPEVFARVLARLGS